MAKTYQFYGSFSIDLERLSRALTCIRDNPGNSTAGLSRRMGVNEPVGESYIGWLAHTGLMKSTGRTLTSFGGLVAEHDPMLLDLGTQWLLHYHLATEHEERSDAWYELLNNFLSPGRSFHIGEFKAHFASTLDANANKKAATNDPVRAVNTYASDALRALGIIERAEEGGEYRVGRPALPDIQVVAFMLFDWWERFYNAQDTVRFTQVWRDPESLGKLCVVGAQGVQRLVRDMAGRGWLSYSESQNEPVNRIYSDPAISLLESYYPML